MRRSDCDSAIGFAIVPCASNQDSAEEKMRTLSVTVVAAAIVSATARAETFNYSCKTCAYPSFANETCEEIGSAALLRVDDSMNVLEWRGRKYDLTIASADEADGCGNYGWHAKGNGKKFTFCTATKGYGAIEDNEGVKVQCTLIRNKR
ncbi:hypothetical protein [Rhodopseudomonas sp.]|uniref:hypothetical protein n=1 Tax=Rhodopseudomonas sp. TaxID=1078 RepID=UPI003B3AB0C9